jgi:cytochrome c-type biogenesis protein CcmH/NrfG
MGHLDHCLALDPDHIEALMLRARSRRAAGQLEAALADAERAVALAPQDPAALSLLALIEDRLGLKERAVATSTRHQVLKEQLARMHELEEQVQQRPADPEPRWRLGDVAAEAGLTDFAARHYQAALSLDPTCQPALRGLADLGHPAANSALTTP